MLLAGWLIIGPLYKGGSSLIKGKFLDGCC